MGQSDSPKNSSLERFSERLILISGLGVLVITLLVSFDVLMRYFLDQPQLFVDELTSFILVGVIFLGSGPTFYRGAHIRVDLITSHLRPKFQTRLRVITLIIGIVLLGIIAHETWVTAVSAFQTGRISAVMAYPLWTAMVFVPLGLILMVFFMLVDLVKKARGGERKVQENPEDFSREISH